MIEARHVRYWHLADIRGTATICPLSDNSGHCWISARDGSVANDPKRPLRLARLKLLDRQRMALFAWPLFALTF
jgi:hypothetical protein